MTVVLVFALGSSVMAFHEAAGLICNKCHTMHYSQDGAAPLGSSADGPHPHLLLMTNTTDLCLSCHDGTDPNAHDVYVATVALPGGDYGSSSTDEETGHNPGFEEGSEADPQWSTQLPEDTNFGLVPPDGSSLTTTALEKWDCVSCHAPHQGDGGASYVYGTASTFRMLWSKPAAFSATDTPVTGDGSQDLTSNEIDTIHSGYQSGMSAWCGACHGQFHNDTKSGDWLIHPSGFDLPPAYITNYGNTTQGGATNSYSCIVPVEQSTATTGDFEVVTGAKVMCLSCHRSHGASTVTYTTPAAPTGYATGTLDMTRWDMDAVSGANSNCNKCHAKGN